MIVCVCNVVSDRDIDQAVMEGVESLEQLADRLELGMCCGVCTEAASQCLNRALCHKAASQAAA